MKKLFTLCTLLLSFGLYFSQNYKDELAKKTCDCIGNLKKDNKSSKQLEMELGLCMFKHAMPYSEEIKKDFGIDLKKDLTNEKKMEDFGIKMGLMLASTCSDKLVEMMGNEEIIKDVAQNIDEEEAAESGEEMLNGTITKIEKDQFITFYIVGDNKVLHKFHWVSKIESNLDLPKEYMQLVNKRATVSYYSADIFDYKINEYKKLNILSTLRTD